MSLNKFMHPRNRYKYRKPNFEALAQKYPEFKKYLIHSEKGKAVLDFKNPEAVRALTTCLLQEDYGLKVEIPPDRLVPTVPLRLNYLHWIEDITKDWNKQELKAIDIGTGACCIYPILAISSNPWWFLATEADDVNFAYATKNLQANNLTGKIKVVKVDELTILEGVIGNVADVYDFCMCNPPFFADHFEAQGLLSRTPSRPEPKTMSTASPQEGIVQGGEIAFVRKMIEESNILQERVRVYTTMLGKKTSVAPLKEILRRLKINNFGSTEFCQGNTMRWGLAWSFDQSVKFPKSEFSQVKKGVKKSLVHIIPTQIGQRREQVYDLVAFLKQIFRELKVHCREGKQTKFFALLTITAAENTWIHSRRKRRQMIKDTTSVVTPEKVSKTAALDVCTSQSAKQSDIVHLVEHCATSQTVDDFCVTEHNGSLGARYTALREGYAENRTNSQQAAVVDLPHQMADANTTAGDLPHEDPATGDLPHQVPDSDPVSGDISHQMADANTTAGDLPHEDPATGDLPHQVSDSDPVSGDVADANIATGDLSHEDHATGDLPHQASEADTAASDLPEAVRQTRKRKSENESKEGSEELPTKRSKLETQLSPSGQTQSADEMIADEGLALPNLDTHSSKVGQRLRKKDPPPSQFVLKCHMCVRVQSSDLAVELAWLDGQNIELLHQLMQYLKNRLSARQLT